MKIYKCDACEKEVKVGKIVGNEFEYKGFKTTVLGDDLCAKCYKKLDEAVYKHTQKSSWFIRALKKETKNIKENK